MWWEGAINPRICLLMYNLIRMIKIKLLPFLALALCIGLATSSIIIKTTYEIVEDHGEDDDHDGYKYSRGNTASAKSHVYSSSANHPADCQDPSHSHSLIAASSEPSKTPEIKASAAKEDYSAVKAQSDEKPYSAEGKSEKTENKEVTAVKSASEEPPTKDPKIAISTKPIERPIDRPQVQPTRPIIRPTQPTPQFRFDSNQTYELTSPKLLDVKFPLSIEDRTLIIQGCNTHRVTYQADEGRNFKVNSVASTRKACPNDNDNIIL